MKTYTKPSMMVLSISANDPLCSGCNFKTRGNALSDVWEGMYATDENGIVKDGVFTYEEALSANLFDEGSCENQLIGYCKMQFGDIIFTS